MSDYTWKSKTTVSIPLMRFTRYDDEIGEHSPVTIRADRIESYEELGVNRVYVTMSSGIKHHFDVSYEEFNKRYIAVMTGKSEEGDS